MPLMSAELTVQSFGTRYSSFNMELLDYGTCQVLVDNEAGHSALVHGQLAGQMSVHAGGPWWLDASTRMLVGEGNDEDQFVYMAA